MIRGIELVLAALFLVAAVLKALDLEAFAVQVSFYGVLREPAWVRAAAWGTLALETALGAALLAHIRLRGWTPALTLAMLLGFTGLIAYAWAFRGLGDCGCFGKYLKMTPAVSIGKNVVMMLLAAALFGSRTPAAEGPANWWLNPSRWTRVVAIAISVAVVAVPAGLGVVRAQTPDPGNSMGSAGPVPKDAPFAQFRFEADGRTYDLGRGEYLVAMLSTTCEHCKASVAPLNELALTPDMPPVVALMLGHSTELEQFRAETDSQFPTVLIKNALTFFQFVGKAPPRIILIRGGKEIQHWDQTAPTLEAVMRAREGTAPAATPR